MGCFESKSSIDMCKDFLSSNNFKKLRQTNYIVFNNNIYSNKYVYNNKDKTHYYEKKEWNKVSTNLFINNDINFKDNNIDNKEKSIDNNLTTYKDNIEALSEKKEFLEYLFKYSYSIQKGNFTKDYLCLFLFSLLNKNKINNEEVKELDNSITNYELELLYDIIVNLLKKSNKKPNFNNFCFILVYYFSFIIKGIFTIVKKSINKSFIEYFSTKYDFKEIELIYLNDFNIKRYFCYINKELVDNVSNIINTESKFNKISVVEYIITKKDFVYSYKSKADIITNYERCLDDFINYSKSIEDNY